MQTQQWFKDSSSLTPMICQRGHPYHVSAIRSYIRVVYVCMYVGGQGLIILNVSALADGEQTEGTRA